MAIENDLGANGLLTYALTQLSPVAAQPLFTVHLLTGELSTTGSINASIDYRLMVTAMVKFNHTHSNLVCPDHSKIFMVAFDAIHGLSVTCVH